LTSLVTVTAPWSQTVRQPLYHTLHTEVRIWTSCSGVSRIECVPPDENLPVHEKRILYQSWSRWRRWLLKPNG